MFPAGPIAWIVSFILCVLAIIESASKMRLLFAAVFILVFILPLLFPALIPPLVLLLTRVALGIFCYFYLKVSTLRFGS